MFWGAGQERGKGAWPNERIRLVIRWWNSRSRGMWSV